MASELRNLIEKKRDGHALTENEIKLFIDIVVQKQEKKFNRDITENISCQIGAMLMAIYHSGMNDNEITALTKTMVNSGKVFKWKEEWKPLLVDKHSTGGVGDKVSHVLVPALAACGLKIPMISGRSLGFTGGTLDKLESIPNFKVCLTVDQMEKCLEQVGACIVGQTNELVPADKVLYASRDITGTVNNIPLIIGSIVSKKLCEGISALIFDVKTGKSAFCETEEKAKELASKMVKVTYNNGIKTSAFITTMDAPIGKMIGNSLEIKEAIQCLSGNGPSDLEELVQIFGAELLFLTSQYNNREKGKETILKTLKNGTALEKFRQILIYQGVEEKTANKCIKDPCSVLPKAKYITEFKYHGKRGIVSDINGKTLALLIKTEEHKNTNLSYAVGIELTVQLGDTLNNGDIWLKFHSDEKLPDISSSIQSALTVGEKFERKPLIRELISCSEY